ncbi:MAG: tetratricopeptide repeat protein, partial [Xenococcus sp. (in: cyanobacteria)]
MSVAEYLTQAKKQVKEQKWQEASDSWQKIIELEPNRWDINFNLGQVLTQQQRYEEAIQAYKNAIAINNNYAWTYHNLGIILLHYIKLIVLLRNPVDRSISAYYQNKKTGKVTQTLEEVVMREIKHAKSISNDELSYA